MDEWTGEVDRSLLHRREPLGGASEGPNGARIAGHSNADVIDRAVGRLLDGIDDAEPPSAVDSAQ